MVIPCRKTSTTLSFILALVFITLTLAAPPLAGLTLSGCRAPVGDPGGDQEAGPPAASLDPAKFPLPVTSSDGSLVAFVATDGGVYTWAPEQAGVESKGKPGLVGAAKAVYRPANGWNVRILSLSPGASQPNLAVAEAQGDNSPATSLTIVDLDTGEARQALPAGNYSPEISSLQWSGDGRNNLFVNGSPPLVLAVTDTTTEVVADLSAMAPAGGNGEARRPLLSPDFSVAAFTWFDWSASSDEDLWVLPVASAAPGDPVGGPSAPERVTTGNIGAYPVAWLGGAADGSQPAGPYDYILVQLGALSTGGGLRLGLATVNVRTKEVTALFTGSDDGIEPSTYRAALIDLPGRKILINRSGALTGQGGRTFWFSLADGEVKEVPGLEGLILFEAAAIPGTGSVVALAHDPNGAGNEIWAIRDDGQATRVCLTDGLSDTHLIGEAGGRAVFFEVDSGGGDPTKIRATFSVLDPADARLRPVELKGETSG